MRVHLSGGRRRSLFHAGDSTNPAVFQHHHDLIVEKDEHRSRAAHNCKRYPPVDEGPHTDTSIYKKQTSAFPQEFEEEEENSSKTHDGEPSARIEYETERHSNQRTLRSACFRLFESWWALMVLIKDSASRCLVGP